MPSCRLKRLIRTWEKKKKILNITGEPSNTKIIENQWNCAERQFIYACQFIKYSSMPVPFSLTSFLLYLLCKFQVVAMSKKILTVENLSALFDFKTTCSLWCLQAQKCYLHDTPFTFFSVIEGIIRAVNNFL